MDTDGDDYQIVHDFTPLAGRFGVAPNNDLVAVGTTLYGSTYLGGDTSVSPNGYGFIYKFDTAAAAVPEPSSLVVWSLLLVSIGSVVSVASQRRHQRTRLL